MKFVHQSLAQRVVFAPGEASAAVGAEIEAIGASKVMLIASRRPSKVVESIAATLPVVLRHDEVVMHVPLEVADRARTAAAASGADVIVTVGGGSATGLGKAVALTTGLPIIAVPTTYAGSEATDVWGLTEGETKTTGVASVVLPTSIVYDATLLASLPVDVAVASGLNAVAHGVDAMWGPRVDPIDQALAAEGLRGLAEGLVRVASDPSEVAGIEQTLYGAYLAAVSFASAGSGMHHKICHVLGGTFHLPHAPTHAVVLPHVLAFNAPWAPEATHRIARAWDAPSAVEGLSTLRARVSAPSALKDYGMPESGIATAVGPIMAAIPSSNPAPVTRENLTALLSAAWSGQPASAR
ncbi:maleylacetate reductase [Nocardioides sp. AN3]